MPSLVQLAWLLAAFSTARSDQPSETVVSYPPGSPRRCFTELGDKALRIDVLPGRGWDNLRNVEQSPVLAYNYSKCYTTYDGIHLLPDHMSAIPVLQSKVDTHLQIFDSLTNYTSLTASSVNSDITVYSVISGQFSAEHSSFKQRVVSQRSIMTRAEIRHLRYVIRSHPSATLRPSFRHRILQIAASIQGNLTQTATYLSQLLVRDYGTHYIHTTFVGGVLTKKDYLQRENIKNTLGDKTDISAGAQADFFEKVNLKFELSFKHETSQRNAYQKILQSSGIETYGGPLFTTNMTVQKWEAGVESTMVAIDRDGDPIHFLITPTTLPEVPPAIVVLVAAFVKEAVDKYYSVNTHRGCTDFSSPNFDYFANIDDGSCKGSSENFTFGGVYQTCTTTQGEDMCWKLEQKNPLTQGFTCPKGYQPIRLMTGKESYTVTRPRCWTTYRRCGFLWLSRCASGQACQTETVTSMATFQTFWCAAPNTGRQENHYYFGGIYTGSTPNPLTGTHGCPNTFRPLKFTSKGHLCISADNELGRPQSLPFGGFHSCSSGNPFAKHTDKNLSPKECPKGFSQHLALVDDDCEVKYCLRSGALSNILQTPIMRPPFMDLPDSFLNETNNLYIVDVEGNIWASKGTNGKWDVISPDSEAYVTAVNKLNSTLQLTTPKRDGLDKPIHTGLIGAAVGVIVVILLLVIVCTVCKIVRYCYRRRHPHKEEDFNLPEYNEAGGRREGVERAKETDYMRLEVDPAGEKVGDLRRR